jgi:type IV secretory pathway TraG/TraD family ATPase VirD4
MSAKDSAVIFATKREMIDGFYHTENGDILLEYNASDPKNIWNIFSEMEESDDPQRTLTEHCDVMFSKYKNTVQPFFTNASKDMFKSLTMYLAESYELRTGKKPTNSTLIGFFDTVTFKDSVVNGKKRKGLLTLIKEVPGLQHLSDYLGDGSTAQALGVLGELRAVLKGTFQGGAFVKPGSFSVRRALKEGKKIFLLYDYAESTESSIVFFDMIIDQIIKQSLAENDQKVWFILDEFSLLGYLQYLQSALAFGRGNGFRIIAAVQSVQLMEKNYSESEANCMLGLFPNIFCFFTGDYKSRQLMSNRYGKNLVSVIGYGSGKPELRERSVIQDEDFYKIALPGDSIVSLAGYSPFFFRNHKT